MALGKIGGQKALKQLSKTKRKDKDEFVRKVTEMALKEIRKKNTQKILWAHACHQAKPTNVVETDNLRYPSAIKYF